MRIRGYVAAGAVLLLLGCDALIDDPSGKEQRGYRGKPLGSVSEPRPGPLRPPAGKASAEPRTGDFNGDGYDDLAAEANGRVIVVYGSARGPDPRVRTSARVSAALDAKEVDGPWYPADVLTFDRGDLDRDGFTDLTATRRDRKRYAMWGGPRGPVGIRRLDTGERTVGDLESAGWATDAGGDFDNDGSTDVFRPGPANGSEGSIHFGPSGRDGRPARVQALDGKNPKDSAPYQAVAGDFDADGYDDLTVSLRWTNPDMEGDGVTYPPGATSASGAVSTTQPPIARGARHIPSRGPALGQSTSARRGRRRASRPGGSHQPRQQAPRFLAIARHGCRARHTRDAVSLVPGPGPARLRIGSRSPQSYGTTPPLSAWRRTTRAPR